MHAFDHSNLLINGRLIESINSFANKSVQLAEVARNVLCRGIVVLLPLISEEHMHF
jgi:hypothetical protein